MSGRGIQRPRGRRRVQTRSALLLSLCACTLSLSTAAISRAAGAWPGAALLATQAVLTVAAFALPAWLGLCVLDGDQRRLLPMRALSAPHILHLCLAGVLAVCPATLLRDAMLAAAGARGAAAGAAPAGVSALFLPQLLKSALLVPVCEELFFRGYLMGALDRFGRGRAIFSCALLFALAHGVADVPALLTRVLLGMLFGAVTLKTGSLLAPMLVHGCYNLALLLIAFGGLAPLFNGLSLPSCAVRLLGCLAFYATLARVYALRASRAPLRFPAGLCLTRREIAYLAAAVLALLIAVILSGVMGL